MAKKKTQKLITPLIDNEITDKNYYDDHMYISNSTLKLFMDNPPRKFQHLISNPPKPSSAMKFGTAFHMLALEGMDTFLKHYAVEPDGVDKRTTLGKATWEKFLEQSQGREHLSHKDYKIISTMEMNLRESQHSLLLSNCDEFEKIYLWKNNRHGILCKGKLDAVNTKKKYIVDLKTTRSAEPVAFMETIINQKYLMQAAFYCDALGYKDYYIYAIEKSKPYCVGVYKVSEQSLSTGRELYNMALRKYKEYVDSGEFPMDYNNNLIFNI